MTSRHAPAGLITNGDSQPEEEYDNWQEKPKCKHPYCRNGLFFDVEPPHTHAQCHNCHQMARCRDSANESGTFRLRRCANCHLDQYCSKECQKEAWRNPGSKEACKFFANLCKESARIAGTPNAWPDLAEWARFHHNAIMNATLACCIMNKDARPNVSSTHVLLLDVEYRNDPTIPVERKFDLITAEFLHKDDPQMVTLYPLVGASRDNAVLASKRECGASYWGTGSYLILTHFRLGDPQPGMEIVPYYKHFGIDKHYVMNAMLACRNPLFQLKENMELGRKMCFCCSGRPEGALECCCGGWTHEKRTDSDL
ncbi:hypothetical protein L226DRAFT_612065 [Lentinus tigrinus ALCF2SS1-7]|uniref:MYND-type domain-containing protein n=1 Tax=Lentinus tigrinus ALCF2SS1-6 TaxID=1328759 RepID=A0A5C2S9J9_9APHY|nr:hypothetical protein L227DRAFT_653208 [Lentinus tigrinus ALCF2SS1-6]RPD75745.1 hypothetical protein L226DRAFT_612065 [Lentinus tigrinus ALCF2SS1-7]